MATTVKRDSKPVAADGPSSARRQEYIDAAAHVFYLHGYDTATIGDLANAMGVTKGAVYYYVDGKEDLLYLIISEMHQLNLANLDHAKRQGGDAISRLWHYFRGHARLNIDHLEKTTVVYRDLDHLSPERRGEIVEMRDRTQRFVRDLLVEAVAAGTGCTLLDVELASIQMFATANALHSWYHLPGKAAAEEVARDVADFVVAAVACAGPGDATCPRHSPMPAPELRA